MKSKEVAQSNVIFTASNILSTAIAFVFSIVLANLLGDYAYGLYSFCLTIVAFFAIFHDFGMGSIIVRFVSNYMGRGEKGMAGGVIRYVTKFKLSLVLFWGIVLTAFPDFIASAVFNKPETSIIVFLSGSVLVVDAVVEYLNGVFTAFKNFKYVSFMVALNKVLRFVVVIGLVFLGAGAVGAIYGLIISGVMLVGVSLILLRRYSGVLAARAARIDKRILFVFGAWVFIGAMTTSIYTITDSFMISILMSVESMGFYKIATTWMFTLVSIIPISAVVMFPYFSGTESRDKLKSMLSLSIKYASMIAFPLALIVSVFSGPLIMFLYKDIFLPAAPVLAILAFASLPLVFGSIITSYFSGINRPDIPTKIILIMLVVNVVLNYFFIMNYGILGAAIATVISKFSEMGMLFSVGALKFGIGFRKSYIMKPLAASIIVYGVGTLIQVNSLVELVAYGIGLLGMYIVVLFAFRGIRKDDLMLMKASLPFFR
jgi:O-antigen/teichoic acid export membrane protein